MVGGWDIAHSGEPDLNFHKNLAWRKRAGVTRQCTPWPMHASTAEAIASPSEPTVAGSSTAPILIDIPLNHDGTMGPLNDDGTMGPVDFGSPPGFFEDLATWTPPPVNAVLHTATPPPSTSVLDPTFSFSPQTASQNPWQADRTFEF